jgi:CubicO group peptidase (beta-lactamase class C family)
MKTFWPALLILALITACGSDDTAITNPPVEETMYFPPLTGSTWETKTPADYGWDETQVQPLLDFLAEKHTRSFMILVNGRIVMEQYFNGHTATTPWYWASAGKALTATVTGIAEQEGFLDRNDKVSDYLGNGWTSAPQPKEGLIKLQHLLTMTSGLNDALGDDVSAANLQYVADAGTRWAYHNVYLKLQDVVAVATGQTWENYFNTALKNKIGMTGAWLASGDGDDLSVYWSTTRSMARFGLLALNNGVWDGEQIINEAYFNDMVTTSQNINQSYGYLWWLNGKNSYHMPQTQLEFPGSLVPHGPADMFMALGKNDQKIYVIPSKNMVVIRMGDAADDVNWALSGFDDDLWVKINAVIE